MIVGAISSENTSLVASILRPNVLLYSRESCKYVYISFHDIWASAKQDHLRENLKITISKIIYIASCCNQHLLLAAHITNLFTVRINYSQLELLHRSQQQGRILWFLLELPQIKTAADFIPSSSSSSSVQILHTSSFFPAYFFFLSPTSAVTTSSPHVAPLLFFLWQTYSCELCLHCKGNDIRQTFEPHTVWAPPGLVQMLK